MKKFQLNLKHKDNYASSLFGLSPSRADELTTICFEKFDPENAENVLKTHGELANEIYLHCENENELVLVSLFLGEKKAKKSNPIADALEQMISTLGEPEKIKLNTLDHIPNKVGERIDLNELFNVDTKRANELKNILISVPQHNETIPEGLQYCLDVCADLKEQLYVTAMFAKNFM